MQVVTSFQYLGSVHLHLDSPCHSFVALCSSAMSLCRFCCHLFLLPVATSSSFLLLFSPLFSTHSSCTGSLSVSVTAQLLQGSPPAAPEAPGTVCGLHPAWQPPSSGVHQGHGLQLPGEAFSSQSYGQSHIVPCCMEQSFWVSFASPDELTALLTTKVPICCLCPMPVCQLNRCSLLQMNSRSFSNWQMVVEHFPDSFGDKSFLAAVCGELAFCIMHVL